MTHLNSLLTLAAVLGVLGYYLYLWLRAGSDVHAGKVCPTCDGDPEYSHIT